MDKSMLSPLCTTLLYKNKFYIQTLPPSDGIVFRKKAKLTIYKSLLQLYNKRLKSKNQVVKFDHHKIEWQNLISENKGLKISCWKNLRNGLWGCWMTILYQVAYILSCITSRPKNYIIQIPPVWLYVKIMTATRAFRIKSLNKVPLDTWAFLTRDHCSCLFVSFFKILNNTG